MMRAFTLCQMLREMKWLVLISRLGCFNWLMPSWLRNRVLWTKLFVVFQWYFAGDTSHYIIRTRIALGTWKQIGKVNGPLSLSSHKSATKIPCIEAIAVNFMVHNKPFDSTSPSITLPIRNAMDLARRVELACSIPYSSLSMSQSGNGVSPIFIRSSISFGLDSHF